MGCKEYLSIALVLISDQIMGEYNLHAYENNGYMYCEIQWGMYDLPQAGILSNNLLTDI